MKHITLRKRTLTGGELGRPAGEAADPDAPADHPRGRATLAAMVVGCLVLVSVAITGAGSATPGLGFFQSGHWLYNSKLGTAFHIDGGTKTVDAEVPVPGADPGSPVIQTDTSGYVLSQGRSYEFGKSDLTVDEPKDLPATERPVGIEASGVAFAIQRQAGQVTRFGRQRTVVQVGGPVGGPVVTPQGTLWLHRQDTGQLCDLPLDADQLSCPERTMAGHAGSLTVVVDRPVFVDVTAKSMHTVGPDGLGPAVTLGDIDITDKALVATVDVGGRIAILDPVRQSLHLVDPAALTGDRPTAPPVTKSIRPGTYDQIVSSGTALAMVDRKTNTLVTLDRLGNQTVAVSIARNSGPGAQPPALVRGEDSRIYLDNTDGDHAMVVDREGGVTEVGVDGGVDHRHSPGPGTKQTPTPQQPSPPPPTPIQTPDKPPATHTPPEPTRTRPTQPRRTEHPTQPPTRKPTTKPTTPKPPPKPTPPPGRPGAPRSVGAGTGDRSALVTWAAAASNGAQITAYVVTWSGGSKTVGGTARQAKIENLQSQTGYVFVVKARNRVGTGPGASSPRVVTPGGVAGAPRNFRANPADRSADLSWSQPPLNGGTLQYYDVGLFSDPSSQNPIDSRTTTGLSMHWSGLTNGRQYYFRVRAVVRTSDGQLRNGATAGSSCTPGP